MRWPDLLALPYAELMPEKSRLLPLHLMGYRLNSNYLCSQEVSPFAAPHSRLFVPLGCKQPAPCDF